MIRPKLSNIIEVTFSNFKDTVMEANKPVVIKFTTSTCPLCKGFRPIFDRASEDYEKAFIFANVNTILQPNLMKFFKVDGVPEVYIVNPKEQDPKKRMHLIPYPDKPSEKTGFPEDYFRKQLDKYIQDKL
jgi:thioredoxin 1